MEKCMAVVNNSLIKHKLLLGVDDRGKISCHKVNLCFIYFSQPYGKKGEVKYGLEDDYSVLTS